nr:arginine/serine-rich coiled-coil protein 2 [Bactrocera oleae]XP_036215457.1 arginine/serine-rich coiled-coil protein 2 [Bactrocera oleae]XP_036215458.1 arginine/serine-rich coiled-coil protein 2 [Bactrocera oleae]
MYAPDKELTPVSSDNTLSEFIDESKSRLNEILKRLEWHIEPDTATDTALRNEKQNDKQLVIDFEPDFPPSCASDNFCITDVEELRKVLGVPDKDVPKRFSDLQLNFSRTEKLSLYEHVIANTNKYTEPEITVGSLDEGSLTFAEIVAQKKRETKKRRRYRRSKPTHIEEVRAVVDLQMQSLQQYLKEKESEERMNQLIVNEKYKPRSDRDGKSSRGSNGRIHTSAIHRNKQRSRSRSRSYERRSHKKNRHRSRSGSNHQSKKYRRDRSSSKSRKHRNRSRSKSRRKTHKRRSRSRSPPYRSNNNRNKLHYRQRE